MIGLWQDVAAQRPVLTPLETQAKNTRTGENWVSDRSARIASL
jgi:hypothetical protein